MIPKAIIYTFTGLTYTSGVKRRPGKGEGGSGFSFLFFLVWDVTLEPDNVTTKKTEKPPETLWSD